MLVKTEEETITWKEKTGLKRYWALRSLYYLCKYILFKDEQSDDDKHPIASDLIPNPHQILCDWATSWTKVHGIYLRKLAMLARDSFKTSLMSIGWPIQCLLRDPNDSILIGSQERGYSIGILRLIKKQMEENEDLIAINGGPFRGGYAWKEWGIFIAGKKSLADKQPSIGTTGIDGVKAGPHPAKIVLDDPMSEKNTGTDEMIEQLIRNYRYLSPMLKKSVGQMLINGTPYRSGDLYDYIIRTPAERNRFEFFFAQARKNTAVLPDIPPSSRCIKLPKGREGTLLLPKRLTKEFLDQAFAEDPVFATSQYEIGLISDETAEFKRDWFHYYTSAILPKDLIIVVAVDPAISVKKTADYTAIVVMGQDPLGNYYVLKLIRERYIDPDMVIQTLYDLFYNYQPRSMAIESNGFQRLMAYNVIKEGQLRGMLPIQPIQHYGAANSKTARIRRLIPLYKNGKIYHLAAGEDIKHVDPGQRILESELLQFRGDKTRVHDDCPDTLSLALEVSEPRWDKAKIKSTYYRASSRLTGY